MLFTTIDFAVFLPIVFVLYWLTNRSLRLQNIVVVASSYVFYGWWDWRFLSLMFLSTLLDYCVGIALSRQDDEAKRRRLLAISVAGNIGSLAFFKYANFFVDNFATAFSFFGQDIGVERLEIVLPVGISFYSFQTLSYGIDVYRRQLVATRDPIAFAAFVSFFPQLVAGPIERAVNLLPQCEKPRTFSRTEAVDGSRQMLWGFFKKMVIADNCAVHVETIFRDHETLGGSTLLLGTFLFAMQIYCDFSGYSDIAIGLARLFGFRLMRNFAYPYFARDIAEFWRCWHISLSTWFRDYVYFPIGGSRCGVRMRVRNTFILFLVSGFWHGANWTFIAWGALNAMYFLPLLLTKRNRFHTGRVAPGRLFPSLREASQMGVTFLLTCLGWVFFRASSVGHAVGYLKGIFSPSLFTLPRINLIRELAALLLLIAFFQALEWLGRHDQYAIERVGLGWRRLTRWSFYAFLVFLIGMFMSTVETPFIYFQF